MVVVVMVVVVVVEYYWYMRERGPRLDSLLCLVREYYCSNYSYALLRSE